MASISSPALFPLPNSSLSSPNDLPRSVSLRSTFLSSGFLPKSLVPTRCVRDLTSESLRVTASRRSFDVVVVGAGIIGLTIARQFLHYSDLSVAVVDKSVPCSGATGAGQGYIWMTHKKPGSEIWDLALRSHELWHKLADSISDPQEALGWKKTGSLLIGRREEESVALKTKVDELSKAGLRAEYLSNTALHLKEPALLVDNETTAAFLPDDSQLDAHRSVSYILESNRGFASQGRYEEFYNDPVTALIRSNEDKEVVGVQTSNLKLFGKKAVIVAAGCWSGLLMHDLLKGSDITIDVPVKPRKGHLLVVENFDSFYLNHGLMEVGYGDHQSIALDSSLLQGSDEANDDDDDDDPMLSISMTATMDNIGNLVLGSSREFVGFNTKAEDHIIRRIWERAGEFFPKLTEMPFADFVSNRKVRVGLRPYMPDGKPLIGAVPGLHKLYLAAGHEGGGLSMALGTAEMVYEMVKESPLHVDGSAFRVKAIAAEELQ